MAPPSSLLPLPVSHSSSDRSRYDFKPFLSAPAVLERARETGGDIRPLHIPGSRIPSPLARHISPDHLIELKAFLVGSGPKTSSHAGNGREIWLSWKRAWDLWNNHYIHGRVNPTWIKGEFERIRKQEQQDDYLGLDRSYGKGFGVDVTNLNDDESTTHMNRSHGDTSCGGFRAIKDFPEFKEPPQFDPEIGDNGTVWDDLISNSVWRPRRVGEDTLEVGVDVDRDDFLRYSPLERDRGVDCGRLPYPVLRPLTEYMQLESGTFKKKKVWDGVTGTVFNMPTKPLKPIPEPEDDRLKTVGQMFGDSYRDFKSISTNDDIFPLDIRRTTRLYPPPQVPKIIPPLLDNKGDAILRDRQAQEDSLHFAYRDMWEDDPWYLTEEQRDLVDYPPRRYPPPEQCYKPESIPVDDTIFREEFDSDQLNLTRYFVTNLHGGTLIINGVEIRKGDVAGPLPKFAVIECPGGQIAFWFGSYGRNHLAGIEESSHIKWLTLRQQPGWRYTGLSAGQVWDAKIKDRIERKKSGENERDDEQWDEWLSANTAQKQSEETITSVTYKLPLPGLAREELLPLPADITRPHVLFPSEQFELAWITAQRELQVTRGDAMDIDMVPGEELFFMGSKIRSDYIPPNALTQETVVDIWQRLGGYTQQLQHILVDSIRDEEKRQAQAEEKRLESFGLPSKRNNAVVLIDLRAAELNSADFSQLSEEEYEQEIQQEYQRGLQQGLDHRSKGQLQREWNEYTAYIREEQRKRKERESAMLDETRKKTKTTLGGANKEAEIREYANSLKMLEQTTTEQVHTEPSLFPKTAATKPRPKIILNHKSKLTSLMPKPILNTLFKYTSQPSNTASVTFPESDVSSFNSSIPLAPPRDADEEQLLQTVVALSKKSYRDQVEQEFKQQAQAAYFSDTEYLAEHGFASMKEYLDAHMGMGHLVKPTTSNVPSAHEQQDFQTFQNILRSAYAEGSKARARLQNMTWGEYTILEKGLDPNGYLTLMVSEIPVTVDDMPPRTTSKMSSGMMAVQQARWEWLCDIIIEANDFEAQTRAADRPSKTHTSAGGQRYAVI